MASKVSLSQSNLSKLERGVFFPNVQDCLHFSEMTGVSFEYFAHGYIDDEFDDIGGFSIPRHYLSETGSRVRGCRSVLAAFEHFFGLEKLRSFFACNGLDPDYFVFLNHRISFKFAFDIVTHLIKSKSSKNDVLACVSSQYSDVRFHGRLGRPQYPQLGAKDYLKRWVLLAPMYEDNFIYKIVEENKNSFDVAVTPNDHMWAYDKEVWQPFFCEFRKRVIPTFGGLGQFRYNIDELECALKGAKRCVYRISTQ